MTLSAQLRELAGKATHGEWQWDASVVPPDGPERYADVYVIDEDREPIMLFEFNDSLAQGRNNAALLVALRNNLPTILAALELAERLDDPAMVEAFERARSLAMRKTMEAPIPECGDFGAIAQDLDFALTALKGPDNAG